MWAGQSGTGGAHGVRTAMAYVDLNPLRAGIASAPVESEYTSIYERIRRLRSAKMLEGDGTATAQVALHAFSDKGVEPRSIPYRFQDYLALVDWTRRAIRDDKRGSRGYRQSSRGSVSIRARGRSRCSDEVLPYRDKDIVHIKLSAQKIPIESLRNGCRLSF